MIFWIVRFKEFFSLIGKSDYKLVEEITTVEIQSEI